MLFIREITVGIILDCFSLGKDSNAISSFCSSFDSTSNAFVLSNGASEEDASIEDTSSTICAECFLILVKASSVLTGFRLKLFSSLFIISVVTDDDEPFLIASLNCFFNVSGSLNVIRFVSGFIAIACILNKKNINSIDKISLDIKKTPYKIKDIICMSLILYPLEK